MGRADGARRVGWWSEPDPASRDGASRRRDARGGLAVEERRGGGVRVRLQRAGRTLRGFACVRAAGSRALGSGRDGLFTTEVTEVTHATENGAVASVTSVVPSSVQRGN